MAEKNVLYTGKAKLGIILQAFLKVYCYPSIKIGEHFPMNEIWNSVIVTLTKLDCSTLIAFSLL